MSGCECKSGFFSLRDCDGAPAGACSECGRTACTRHLSPASGFTQCLDCHARAQQQPGDGQAQPEKVSSFDEYQRSVAQKPVEPRAGAVREDAALDDEWTYGARHRYWSSGYGPVYTGSHHSHYYDSYDTRSFDETEGGEAEADDGGGGGGFGDS